MTALCGAELRPHFVRTDSRPPFNKAALHESAAISTLYQTGLELVLHEIYSTRAHLECDSGHIAVPRVIEPTAQLLDTTTCLSLL
jgi:hypothetical protein